MGKISQGVLRDASDGNIVAKYGYVSIFLYIRSIDTKTKISIKIVKFLKQNILK